MSRSNFERGLAGMMMAGTWPEAEGRFKLKPLLRDWGLDWLLSINKHEFCITVEIMYYVLIGGKTFTIQQFYSYNISCTIKLMKTLYTFNASFYNNLFVFVA